MSEVQAFTNSSAFTASPDTTPRKGRQGNKASDEEVNFFAARAMHDP